MLKKLLLLVVVTGTLGSAGAESAPQMQKLDTPARTESGSIFASGDWTRYSFADIVNLSLESERRSPSVDTVGRSPDGISARLSSVADSAPVRAHAAAVLTDATYAMSGGGRDPTAVGVPDHISVFRSERPAFNKGAGFLFSTADIPRPAGWITLLCGLVVLAFMARRN